MLNPGDDAILVGDIGGTNCRFAVARFDAGRPLLAAPKSYVCRDFPGPLEAIEDYLSRNAPGPRPSRAAIAVAGPIEHGKVRFTNLGWSLSENALRSAGFNAVLLNDYAALAHAAPLLAGADLVALGEGAAEEPRSGATVVLGPGTGFGAALITAERRSVVTTEAGHVSFAPTDPIEVEVLRILSATFGRVSIERILSGAGLVNLHQALTAIDGRPSVIGDPKEITTAAQGGDAAALATIERFWSILGGVAGDFALAYGASDLLVAGGLAPALLSLPGTNRFRTAFEAKGRFRAYTRSVRTSVIIYPFAALVGAANATLG